jgi:hypothetical protein
MHARIISPLFLYPCIFRCGEREREKERRDAASPRRCWCFFLAESCRVLCKWRLIRRMWGSSPSHAFLRKSVCRSWSQTLIHPLNHQTGPRSRLFSARSNRAAHTAREYIIRTQTLSEWTFALTVFYSRAPPIPLKRLTLVGGVWVRAPWPGISRQPKFWPKSNQVGVKIDWACVLVKREIPTASTLGKCEVNRITLTF